MNFDEVDIGYFRMTRITSAFGRGTQFLYQDTVVLRDPKEITTTFELK